MLSIQRIYIRMMTYYIYIIYNLISSMRISEETKKSLIKIGAELTAKDGRERSMEDVVQLLLDYYRKGK
jgi:predicted nucleotide-binding protein (sugar kinase/HSP70/actin superfamily)